MSRESKQEESVQANVRTEKRDEGGGNREERWVKGIYFNRRHERRGQRNLGT